MLFYAGLSVLVLAGLAVWRGIYLINKFTFRDLKKLFLKIEEYDKEGIGVLINVAAENCRSEKEAGFLLRSYFLILSILNGSGGMKNGHISVKPSSFVLSGWPAEKKKEKFEAALSQLADFAGKRNRRVWLDEERSADEEWVEPVKRALVCDRGITNLSWRIRCYRRDAFRRITEYVNWHKQGASFSIGLCRGAYPEDGELDENETAENILRCARLLADNSIDCVIASHTAIKPITNAKSGTFSLHMLHGREEVDTALKSILVKELAKSRGVYMIYGRSLRSLLPYVLRRLLEKPALFWTQ